MDALCREALRLTWELAGREQQIIGKILPTIKEIIDVFSAGRNPTDEELRRWQTLHSQLSGDMIELTAAFVAVRQLFVPLGFDA